MTSPFDGLEVARELRPSRAGLSFDLKTALDAVVVLTAEVPEDAFTAETLGQRRLGNGVVIGTNGLVLTIGYLITEAENVTLITNDGRQIGAHVLGFDAASGFGLVNALEPLNLPVLPLGDSRALAHGDPVILAGAGGRSHAIAARLAARAPFAGYWEYLLEEALFTEPGHPHWSGAALIGPTGALVGIGSLQLNQMSPNGQVSKVNMSVPIDLLAPIVEDLSRGRQSGPPRPWLGLFANDVARTVQVMEVDPDGPAADAGVRTGDIIVTLAGESVTSLPGFYRRLWALGPAGTVAPLGIKRGGQLVVVEICTIDRASRLKSRRFN